MIVLVIKYEVPSVYNVVVLVLFVFIRFRKSLQRSLYRTSMIIFVYIKNAFQHFTHVPVIKKQTTRDATVRNNILNLYVNICLRTPISIDKKLH